MVAVPVLEDVTRPVFEMVATEAGFIVQETDGLLVVLPSLLVPTACICTVLFVLPVSMVGEAGPTANDEIVGFTKNPLQPTANAKARSTTNTPISRSFFASMLFWDSFRPMGSGAGGSFLLIKIVTEKNFIRTTLPCHDTKSFCARTSVQRRPCVKMCKANSNPSRSTRFRTCPKTRQFYYPFP